MVQVELWGQQGVKGDSWGRGNPHSGEPEGVRGRGWGVGVGAALIWAKFKRCSKCPYFNRSNLTPREAHKGTSAA